MKDDGAPAAVQDTIDPELPGERGGDKRVMALPPRVKEAFAKAENGAFVCACGRNTRMVFYRPATGTSKALGPSCYTCFQEARPRRVVTGVLTRGVVTGVLRRQEVLR